MIKKTQTSPSPMQISQGPNIQAQEGGPSLAQVQANQSVQQLQNNTNQFETGVNPQAQLMPQAQAEMGQTGGLASQGPAQSLFSLQIAEAKADTKNFALEEQANFDAYLESPFGYNDAETLADFWNTDVSNAKGTIGYKMRNGYKNQVSKALGQAVATVAQDSSYVDTPEFQNYMKSEYNYNDAESLADFWGTDVLGAKALIGQKVANGQNDAIDWALNQVAKNSPVAKNTPITGMEDWSNMQAFFKAGYEFSDAKLLAGQWNMPVSDTKDLMGHKLLQGQGQYVQEQLQTAEQSALRGPQDGADLNIQGNE